MQTPTASATDIFPAAIRIINQELYPHASPRRQQIYQRVTRILERAQRQLEKQQGNLPDMYMGIAPPSKIEDFRQWGLRLRQRREEAGLTRAQLAHLAGVADSTIRNLETGRHKPTRPIVMRLQAVPELGMPAGSPLASLFGPGGRARPNIDSDFACNCWFAPEYDSIRMIREMVQRLNSPGGNVEQTDLYIDPASASAWCALTEQDGWGKLKSELPIHDIARAIKDHLGSSPLDVIGLGSGEAYDEVRLAQCLVQEQVKNLRLFLLEISQPLLSAGYKHAAQVLGELPGVGVYAIQGNFHNLPSYDQLFHNRGRRRLACMFGFTFPNLDNEILLLRNSLCGFVEGDLLLVDAFVGAALPSQPDEIMKKDPRLSMRLPHSSKQLESRQLDFLTGPFKRHVKGIRSVRLETALDRTSCPIPGSYAVDWRAVLKMKQGPDRAFSIYHSKRYNPELLDESMGQNGWQPLGRWTYSEDRHPQMVSLYRKQDSPAGEKRSRRVVGGRPKAKPELQ
jgi:transcriptional regulator with XRE-family HTH domain